MEKKKEDIFKAFTAKAVQRLKDKKVTKYETLYVPSIDQNIKIRNLNYPEIVECTEIDDKQDPNASDKYCIYLAVVEPDLRAVAMELKDQGEIKTYPEVVDIFEMNEITSIATEIMKLSGVIGSKKVTVVEEQKNSYTKTVSVISCIIIFKKASSWSICSSLGWKKNVSIMHRC